MGDDAPASTPGRESTVSEIAPLNSDVEGAASASTAKPFPRKVWSEADQPWSLTNETKAERVDLDTDKYLTSGKQWVVSTSIIGVVGGYYGYFGGLQPTGMYSFIVRHSLLFLLPRSTHRHELPAPPLPTAAVAHACAAQVPAVTYLLIWLMFWGVVSHKMDAGVKSKLITLPATWATMWYFEALLPFCIGAPTPLSAQSETLLAEIFSIRGLKCYVWLRAGHVAVWLCLHLVWYADSKNRSYEKDASGGGAADMTDAQGNRIREYKEANAILLYDFYPYASSAPVSIGVFNAVPYILVNSCGMPPYWRFVINSFIAPTLLFIGGDLIPLLRSGGMSKEYRLNVLQCIRLYFMRIGLYTVMFYGMCYKVEELIITEIAGRANMTATEMGLGEF